MFFIFLSRPTLARWNDAANGSGGTVHPAKRSLLTSSAGPASREDPYRPEDLRLVQRRIAEAKAANPDLIYLCGPIMGDAGPGLYVPETIVDVMRERLLPMADIATPNPFELTWLTGREIATPADLKTARQVLHIATEARLIATGCTLEDTLDSHIESAILGPGGISRHPTVHLPIALPGTSDLFAGMIVAGLGHGFALTHAVETAQTLTSRAPSRAGKPE
ncbi:pyridoxal kinase [Ciceribacter lividus]|uniref:pyridoxal kinase n=1 Tax=Ciceribacter lividus TaxID=1197950 RepID=A0A6I7HL50_9HYPH|nr:bifunctional hydroxymethylpyrimidine kinase/phosphomethylpyrimidine kinase [Ciceribacter lividus]RCW22707.1 pyridoxal kinase [Ciceribacter lividus]